MNNRTLWFIQKDVKPQRVRYVIVLVRDYFMEFCMIHTGNFLLKMRVRIMNWKNKEWWDNIEVGTKIEIKEVGGTKLVKGIYNGTRYFDDYGFCQLFVKFHNISRKYDDAMDVERISKLIINEVDARQLKFNKIRTESEITEVERDSSMESQEKSSEERFICSCGNSYAHPAGLWRHLKKSGHNKSQ